MAGSPDPTVEQIFDALPLLGCRLSIVQKELVRRLRNNLPKAITEMNSRMGAAEGKGVLQVPVKDIRVAPAMLIDNPGNAVLVALSERLETQGSRAFRGEVQVSIFSYEPAPENGEMIADMFDRAKLILACLYPFLLNCYDEQNRPLWKLLEPQSVTLLPQQFEGMGGSAVYLGMVQPPGPSNWL